MTWLAISCPKSRLLAARIPCQLVKRQGVFDQEDVKKTLLLLKLLQNPEDDVTLEQYVDIAADLVEQTPRHILYHRLTGTASPDILLAPEWCSKKWAVLNALERELAARGLRLAA